MIYKFILVFIVFVNTLFATSDYEWSAEISKKEVLVNEAVYVKYICKFNKDEELYTIVFNPSIKTKEYDLILVQEKNNVYEFILFVKKAGLINLNFEAIMKKTTLESIAEMTGGLDNEKAKDGFVSEIVKQKVLSLHVEKAKLNLIGKFDMEIKKDELSKKAFSPFHLEIIVKGNGNFQDIKAFKFDLKDVKIFAQKPKKKITITKDGYSGVWSQKFAFVSENNFTIPSISLKYTNPKTLELKNLQSEALHVEVSAGYVKEKLLDIQEKEEDFDYKYLFFLLAFVFGFLIGKIKLKKT